MQLLWGLINSLQIIGHLPLLNLYIPANVYKFFQSIIMLSQINIIPVDRLISSFELDMGIESNEFILTESLADFGYDSSDMIKNLQVMFLTILVLVGIPVFLLLASLCFRWSQTAKQCLKLTVRKLFWNTYIRFLLEAYLALSICSLLRLKQFNFDSSSDSFLSLFACFTIALLIIFLLLSTMVLQMK